MKPTNIVYTIRDDSGVIEVIQWVEGDGGVSFKSMSYHLVIKIIEMN